MRMTKRFHKCDESCKINHRKPKIDVDKAVSKTIKKPVKDIVAPAKKVKKSKLSTIDEIQFFVEKIDNENETNKILEKTLINLRKLYMDLGK